MKHVDTTNRLPIKSWIDADELHGSDGLYAQAANVANLPGAFHHVALMPDAHLGYGMPIGGVLALENAICPGAVGYDIGCGMIAVQTNIDAADLRPRIVEVQRAVRKRIPVGEGGRRDAPVATELQAPDALPNKAREKWRPQLGTLGGGNHFIEFDSDEAGRVWFVIHSGSRGVGHAIATIYMKLAAELCAQWHVPVPHRELAFLPAGTPEYSNYGVAMDAALDYAFENRGHMANDVAEVLASVFGADAADGDAVINVHHNFASIEHHFGRDVCVHRKGATRAREGERLVIPGNMGQGTVICTGLGNADSFCSSSHGAGRRLGRQQAKRTLDYETERAKLDALGVTLSAGRDGALDEMPAAYKDLDAVMAAQTDLVRVEARLTPIGVIKG